MKELVLIGFALIFFGVLAIIAGTMLSAENSKVESAGIIMIGPIPVMFGNKRLLLPLAILAIILIGFYTLLWKQ